MEDFIMKDVALSQDDECWCIAESIVEEVELMKSREAGRLSQDGRDRGSLKGMLMRGLGWSR